jgi:hypothetical protein
MRENYFQGTEAAKFLATGDPFANILESDVS